MTAIPRQRSLLQIAQEKCDHRQSVYKRVVAQIRILIRHGIWHRDLHPGNVLVDEKGTPHIIDFDKARYLKNRDRLTSRYIERWQRAIAKHGLPHELAAILSRKALAT
jgi:predicted unusual protein kinase regulating ubiquinone biosynthesis (AarF/ABC1/UbiB family)